MEVYGPQHIQGVKREEGTRVLTWPVHAQEDEVASAREQITVLRARVLEETNIRIQACAPPFHPTR